MTTAANRVNNITTQLTGAPSTSLESFYTCDNFINGKIVPPSTGKYMDVEAPATGKIIGKVAISGPADIEAAVKSSEEAFKTWGSLTVKARAQILFKLHALIRDNTDYLADLIVLEHGKTYPAAFLILSLFVICVWIRHLDISTAKRLTV